MRTISATPASIKPLSGYIRRIDNGDYQLYISKGAALPVLNSTHYLKYEAQQAARSLHASVVMEAANHG